MEEKTNVKSRFKKRFAELRAKCGLSQSKLGKALSLSPATIGYYENGDRLPDIETAARIAEYFNVSADYLLGLSDAMSTDHDMKTACAVTGLSEKAISEIRDFISIESDYDITDKRYRNEDADFFKKYEISRKIIMDMAAEKVLPLLCDDVLDIFVEISHYFTEMSQRESPLNQIIKYYDVFENCNTEEEKTKTIELLSRSKLIDFDKIFINGNLNDSIKGKVYSGADNYKFAVYELICDICENIPEIKIEPLLENYSFTSEFIRKRFNRVKEQEVTDNAQHHETKE